MVGSPLGCGATEASSRQQFVGIIVDRRDAVLGEQIRHQPHRHLAVLQHVGDARGRARIVLQHIEIGVVDAHDVDAADMHPHVVRRAVADHLRAIVRVAQNQLRRDDVLLEDAARAVDVLQKHVERGDALDQPLLQLAPLAARQQARHNVERDQAFSGFLVAVDAEGDAHAAEHEFGLSAARGEQFGRARFQPARHFRIDAPRRLLRHTHLVKTRRHSSPSLQAGDAKPMPPLRPSRAPAAPK